MSLQLFCNGGKRPVIPTEIIVRECYSRLDDEVDYIDRDSDDDNEASFICSDVTEFHPQRAPRLVILPKVVIFGGLTYDDCCENPMESCDSEGTIEQGEQVIERALGWDNGYINCANEATTRRLVEPLMAWLSEPDQTELLTGLIRMGQDFRSDDYGRKNLFEALEEMLNYQAYDSEASLAYNLFRATGSEVEGLTKQLLDFLLESKEAEAAREDAIAHGEFGDCMSVLLSGSEAPYRLADWSDYNGSSSHYSLWAPCVNAIENIESTAYSDFGLGEVQKTNAGWHFKGKGSTSVSQDVYPTRQQAEFAMIEAHNNASDQSMSIKDLVQMKRSVAEKYCSGVISEYNTWAEGDVHSLSVYVIDRSTGEILSEESYCGYIGFKHAEEELEAMVTSMVEQHLH